MPPIDGGTGVAVAGTLVAVEGTAVAVSVAVAVGGRGVEVGDGVGVSVGVGVAVSMMGGEPVEQASTDKVRTMVRVRRKRMRGGKAQIDYAPSIPRCQPPRNCKSPSDSCIGMDTLIANIMEATY